MPIGTVESISKTSIVLTTIVGTVTLTGKLVENLAPSFKLGDEVEYDLTNKDGTDASQLGKAKPKAAAPAPGASPRTNSSSPMTKMPAGDVRGRSSW